MTKYTEIFKLKKMLEEAKIPFTFYEHCEHWLQILYKFYEKEKDFKCSVIQSDISYGGDENLLEIMGLLTEEEKKQDSVLGFLTAEEVFKRIKEDWENEKSV